MKDGKKKDEEFYNLESFDLVIGTDLTDSEAAAVSRLCREAEKKIPFVLIRQYGLIGTIRLDVHELCVSEMKLYQKNLIDLRLNDPFPALKEFALNNPKFNLDEMDLNLHSHVPFVVVLLKSAEKWKSAHEGNLPKSFKEKDEFKQFIKS